MRTLADIFPTFDILSSVDPEEVGSAVLELWEAAERSRSERRTIDHFINPLFQPGQESPYSKSTEVDVVVIVAEAWNWLWREGLIIPDPTQSSGWHLRTRRGKSGSRRRTSLAARPIHGAVSRLAGSPITDAGGSSGNCSVTWSTSRALVTTKTRSGGTNSTRRSAVCWSMLREPSSSRNCFGRFRRLSGQNRVPDPPAMMTA